MPQERQPYQYIGLKNKSCCQHRMDKLNRSAQHNESQGQDIFDFWPKVLYIIFAIYIALLLLALWYWSPLSDIQMPVHQSTSKKSYVRTFQLAGPGGRAKTSKLLRTFKYKPRILSLPTKILITILVIARLILSVIPVDFHPWVIWYTSCYSLYDISLKNRTT